MNLDAWYIGAPPNRAHANGLCADPVCCPQLYNQYCGVWGCTSCKTVNASHACQKCKKSPSGHRAVHCTNQPVPMAIPAAMPVLNQPMQPQRLGNQSYAVGCFLLRKQNNAIHVLVQARSLIMSANPGLVSGPGGQVDGSDYDIETLNKELAEEALNGYNPSRQLVWNEFHSNLNPNTNRTIRYYWADGQNIQIAGPDQNNRHEVSMNFNWNTLGIPCDGIPGTGHAWIRLDDIPAPRQPNADKFAKDFLYALLKLKTISTI